VAAPESSRRAGALIRPRDLVGHDRPHLDRPVISAWEMPLPGADSAAGWWTRAVDAARAAARGCRHTDGLAHHRARDVGKSAYRSPLRRRRASGSREFRHVEVLAGSAKPLDQGRMADQLSCRSARQRPLSSQRLRHPEPSCMTCCVRGGLSAPPDAGQVMSPPAGAKSPMPRTPDQAMNDGRAAARLLHALPNQRESEATYDGAIRHHSRRTGANPLPEHLFTASLRNHDPHLNRGGRQSRSPSSATEVHKLQERVPVV
jgi:hypothetical protein